MALPCILGVLCGFLDNFFFILLSVHASLRKKKAIKSNSWGSWEYLERIYIYTGTQNGLKLDLTRQIFDSHLTIKVTAL